LRSDDQTSCLGHARDRDHQEPQEGASERRHDDRGGDDTDVLGGLRGDQGEHVLPRLAQPRAAAEAARSTPSVTFAN
jgi:hypothetical protein